MSDVRPALPTRRGVLAGSAALLLSACTRSVDAEPPGPTPDQRLAARVADEIRTLAVAYAATISRHPRTRAELSTLAAEHDAHLAALVAVTPPPTASPGVSSSPSPTPSPTATSPVPPVPASVDAARAALAVSERTAAARRRRQAGRAGPELARLLASIAACEAVHGVLLGGVQ